MKTNNIKNFSFIVGAVCITVFVASCGGGSSGGGGQIDDMSPGEVVSPLVGRWGYSDSFGSENVNLTVDQNGIAVLASNIRESRVYYGKIDLDNVDLGEPAEGVISRRFGVTSYVELAPPVFALGVNDPGPPFFISSYSADTTDFPSTGQIRLNYRSSVGGISIPVDKLGPLEPSPTASRLDEFVGRWRRDATVFSTPDVDYSFEIDSTGRITGSYDNVCAVEGQVTAPVNAADTEKPFMDVAFTGCAQAAEYTFFPFIRDNPPGGDLPERVILLRGLGDSDVILLNLVAEL